MSRYNNQSHNMLDWTNHKLVAAVRNGLGTAPTDKPFHDALDVLESRVVRHKPNGRFDERGQPITDEARQTWIGLARQTKSGR